MKQHLVSHLMLKVYLKNQQYESKVEEENGLGKKTGNKAIKLLDWEKYFLKAMEGDSNPTIGGIGGAIQIGIYEDESIQQRRSEPTAQRRGSKASPEQSCSRVTDIEPPKTCCHQKRN
ncbi:hypothetical protein AVEN_68950-1 [Araneus ventricosus]|uniref:Uncharacterized protein n=1 Tax=Araneus ventricosus TaxID=182803 RepID=A0A4Y2HIE5_ARAVE|nr:hypothetical protein AVEN_68950-1 [Araneus ventricosus]